MSDQDAPSAPASVLVEVHTLFMASSQAEAQDLLDQVMDAELAVVCPPNESRLSVCSHCDGTLVNPDEDDSYDEAADTDDRWAAGLPCALCADTDHPGQEMHCAREHVGGATLHTDGNWMTSEDRRLEEFLRPLLSLLDAGDVDAARIRILERLPELDPGTHTNS